MAGLPGLFVAEDGSDGTTPQGARLALSGLIPWAGPNPLDVAEGVFADSFADVCVGKANMSYDVRAFVATNRLSASVGPVVFANAATVNVATTAAPGSNSRYDVVWVRQHLTAADSGADSDIDVEFGVEQGVVSASPVVPAVPTGALALGAFLVTTGVTATSGLVYTRLHDWLPRPGGGIYASYTPTLGGSITTKTGRIHRFEQNSQKVSGYFDVVMNAAGSGTWTMTAPVAPVTSTRDRVVGRFFYYTGSSRGVGMILILAGDTKFSFLDSAGDLFTGAAANDDWFSGQYEYEADL